MGQSPRRIITGTGQDFHTFLGKLKNANPSSGLGRIWHEIISKDPETLLYTSIEEANRWLLSMDGGTSEKRALFTITSDFLFDTRVHMVDLDDAVPNIFGKF